MNKAGLTIRERYGMKRLNGWMSMYQLRITVRLLCRVAIAMIVSARLKKRHLRQVFQYSRAGHCDTRSVEPFEYH
jgi:hypothetical protein